MGGKGHLEPYGFSSDMNSYLLKVITEDNERTDLSGKWLEKITKSARRYDYWSKLVKDTQAMTTNDIQVLAQAFGLNPYEFVANARRHAAGERVFPIHPVVGTTEDDFTQEAADQQRVPLQRAAKRGTSRATQAFGDGDEGSSGDGGTGGA